MKKILLILSLFVTSTTFAQNKTVIKVQGQPGIYGLTNNETGDSLIFYSQGIRYTLPVKSNVDLSGLVPKTTTVNGKVLSGNITLVKSDVGLSNVDNTSDISKPISTATQNALNLKADKATTLSGYGITDAYPLSGNPSGFITSAAIAGKQDIIPNLSDTSKYLKKVDTTGKWISPAVANATYATITALNSKLNISDTANKWLPKTFTQNLYYKYPVVPIDDSTGGLAQSWKDTVAYKVDVATKANPVFTGTAKINSDTLATIADVRSGVASIPSGGITDFMFLLNRDYANDSLAIVGGLNMGDLYQTSGTVKVVTRSEFSYTIDNTDGSANAYTMRIESDDDSKNLSATVYWGDGSDTVLAGFYYHQVNHTYAPGSSYTVKIITTPQSNLNQVYLNFNNDAIKVTQITNIKSLTNLTKFDAASTGLTNIDTLSFPQSVTAIKLQDCPITSFNPKTPLALTSLTIIGASIEPNGNFYLPPTLTSLTVVAMHHTDGIATWNATDVNNFLVRLDAMTFNAGAKTLDLTQYNSATPSGAGLTAKSSLESKGWTITTD